MKKRLITAALPYVNNVPHLGNLIQVLSADVFARFCRQSGYETLYVCGTDEYGTATETKAKEEGITPQELCDRFHALHKGIYEWFEISFDKFGRTSTPAQTKIVQDLFLALDKEGLITEHLNQQLFCAHCSMFLADRYVRGTCPHCGHEDARGDQCEICGKLLDPTDLKNPRCGTCSASPELRDTKHLYINLPAILPKLETWMKKASVDGFWAHNAIKMTEAWIRDGLKERCITRDLKWGIPVPKPGYENKVFYVWFDAPIGYISITACLTDDWEKWWKDPEHTELFQFIGKDNIPFHTVIFPCTLLGDGKNWTMLHHMSSTEYLNYENMKFSKSKGIGVFGTDVMETGIPADVWRFFVYYNRPEKADTNFFWADFQEKVNSELIGNFGNLINRTLTFLAKFFDSKIPVCDPDIELWKLVTEKEKLIQEKLERAELKDALKEILAISSLANKIFQEYEPWKKKNSEPEKAHNLLGNLAYVLKDLAIMLEPFIPQSAVKVREMLGWPSNSWADLGKTQGLTQIKAPEILFKILENDLIADLKIRFTGTQSQRKEKENEKEAQINAAWASNLDLRVATIIAIEKHPKADKLYIEKIKIGEEERQIVSGLVPYYKEEELLGKNVIVVANLKPAKLRGTDSQGMLLAADFEGQVEVIFPEGAKSGDRIAIEGVEMNPTCPEITIDDFFSQSLNVDNYHVVYAKAKLMIEGSPVQTKRLASGKVG